MGLIFFLSAQPDLSSGLGAWDLVLRKLAHMTVFGALYLLWRHALEGRPWPAAAIAVAYAVTDEIHQHFVSGRHGSPIDVGIDTIGIVLAALLWPRLIRRFSG
jgi:VanZ family protein